jgi:hypothetical protein
VIAHQTCLDVTGAGVEPPTADERKMSIEERFHRFHAQNPWVYREIVSMALKAKGLGRKRIGMKQIFEVIRWNHAIQTRGENVKLNNNYSSRYARLIERQEPDLRDLFETRELKSIRARRHGSQLKLFRATERPLPCWTWKNGVFSGLGCETMERLSFITNGVSRHIGWNCHALKRGFVATAAERPEDGATTNGISVATTATSLTWQDND